MPIGMSSKRPRTAALASRKLRIPCQRGGDLAATRQCHHQLIGGEATETGLISPTSISKVLMPFAFEDIAL